MLPCCSTSSGVMPACSCASKNCIVAIELHATSNTAAAGRVAQASVCQRCNRKQPLHELTPFKLISESEIGVTSPHALLDHRRLPILQPMNHYAHRAFQTLLCAISACCLHVHNGASCVSAKPTGWKKGAYIAGAADLSAHRAADSFPRTTQSFTQSCVRVHATPSASPRNVTLHMGEYLSAVDGAQDVDGKASRSHRKLGDLVNFSSIRKSMHLPSNRSIEGLSDLVRGENILLDPPVAQTSDARNGTRFSFSNIRKSFHLPSKRRADGLEHTIDSLKRDLTAASSKVCSTALVCLQLHIEALDTVLKDEALHMPWPDNPVQH